MNFAHCLHIGLVIGNYTDVFRGIFSGGGFGSYEVGSFQRGSFHDGREFFMKGMPDSPALFNKRSGINKKISFSFESKDHH